MGMLLNKFNKFIKGYPTAIINQRVEGGIYDGREPVEFGTFVAKRLTNEQYYDLIEGESSDIAIVMGTNVKTTLSYGDNPQVETAAGEAFNAFKEGFIALELGYVKTPTDDGDITLVGGITKDLYIAGEIGECLSNVKGVEGTSRIDVISYAEAKEVSNTVYKLNTDEVGCAYLVKVDTSALDPVKNAFDKFYVLSAVGDMHYDYTTIDKTIRFDKGISTDSEGRILVNCYVNLL